MKHSNPITGLWSAYCRFFKKIFQDCVAQIYASQDQLKSLHALFHVLHLTEMLKRFQRKL